MRFLWILLIFGAFAEVQAISPYSKVPPAEMIMMGGFDDDDVESMEEFQETVSKEKDVEKNATTDLYIKSGLKQPVDLTSKNIYDEEIEDSVDFSEYSNQQGFSQNVDLSEYIGKGNLKVALLAPKKVIKSYTNSVSNAIISYLLFKDAPFQFEVFDSGDEEESSIYQKLSEIRAKGYQLVIAPFTQKGAEIVIKNSPDLLVFIPTINKYEIPETSGNIIFGGIDYRKQIDALLTYANDKIVLFNDGSRRSRELSTYIKEQVFDSVIYEKDIKKIKTDLAPILKDNKKIKKSSIFLNMPIVKSSLLASQLSQYDVEPYVILSTQANYNPLLLKLTQSKDREYFYVANSISHYNSKLKEINLLLGNNPDFSWIDYSASIGMDYIFSTQLDSGQRVFEEELYDNQIEYKVHIKRAGDSSFEPIGDRKLSSY